MVFPIVGGNQATGDFITNSLRFDRASSAAMSISSLSSGSTTKATISAWIKRSGLGTDQRYWANYAGSADDRLQFGWQADDKLYIQHGDSVIFRTNQVFRDVSAWYHIVIAIDSTQGSNDNRVKAYLNGSQITSWGTFNTLTQNTEIFANNDKIIIGERETSDLFYDGYLAHLIQVDGSQLAPTQFGETNDNGVWVPIEYTGSFGTNGFKLEFKETGTSANASGIGADTSGNDKHFTLSNLTAIDVVTDTPQNNFAVFRPHGFPQDSRSVISDGNLDFDFTGDGSVSGRRLSAHVVSNIGVTQGKWYAEFKLTEDANGGFVGVSNLSNKIHTAEIESYNYLNTNAGDKYVREHTGESESNAAHGAAVSVNDIVQVALDADNRNVYFGKGGSWASGSGAWNQATPTSAVSYTADFVTTDSHGVVVFNAAGAGSSETPRWQANFGNPVHAISSGNSDANGHGNFEYAVPSGYYALCTKNLAEYG